MTYKDYLYAKASAKRIPIGGAFELSPVCNLSCRMCYIRKTKGEMARLGLNEITADQWIDMAKQCKDAGMLFLLLTGGEPFLYPDFRRLYETLHNMGFLISINTNGTLIDDEMVEWLKKHAPARMNITLYGASRETYSKLCGNPEGYDAAVHAIRALMQAKIHVVINGSITPENKDDLKEIYRFAAEVGCTANVATYMFPPVRRAPEATDSRLTEEESGYLNVMKHKYRLSKDAFENATRIMLEKITASGNSAETWGENESESMKCRAGRSSCWISWEGMMTACGMMDFPATAYPFREGFAESWKKINDAVLKTQVLAECADCTLKEICHPCAAMMYAETGDVNKKSPYLCRMSEISEYYWRKELEK